MRLAIHTAATRDYLPGLEALVWSIRQSDKNIDIYVTTDCEASELPNCCKKIELSAELEHLEPWGMAAYMNGVSLTDYDRVVLMGADQIIVGDMKQLTETYWGVFCAVDGWGADIYKGSFPYFATGILIVEPYHELMGELIEVAEDTWLTPNPYGYVTHDEHTWNEWAFRKYINPQRIPHYFDCSRRVFEQSPSKWALWRDKIFSVHYLGHPKPWVGGSDPLTVLWKSYKNKEPMDLP